MGDLETDVSESLSKVSTACEQKVGVVDGRVVVSCTLV
jgi:hypothetical protein